MVQSLVIWMVEERSRQFAGVKKTAGLRDEPHLEIGAICYSIQAASPQMGAPVLAF